MAGLRVGKQTGRQLRTYCLLGGEDSELEGKSESQRREGGRQQWDADHRGEAMVAMTTECLLMWWPTGHCWARFVEIHAPTQPWRSGLEGVTDEQRTVPQQQKERAPSSCVLPQSPCISLVLSISWAWGAEKLSLQRSGHKPREEGFRARYRYLKTPWGGAELKLLYPVNLSLKSVGTMVTMHPWT